MEHPTPRRVAVLAGGYSGEAEVSRKSAAMVLAHMDRVLFAPVLIHIDVEGWWCERPSDGMRVSVDQDTFSFANAKGDTWAPELAFVIVHGTPGEDGILATQPGSRGHPPHDRIQRRHGVDLPQRPNHPRPARGRAPCGGLGRGGPR